RFSRRGRLVRRDLPESRNGGRARLHRPSSAWPLLPELPPLLAAVLTASTRHPLLLVIPRRGRLDGGDDEDAHLRRRTLRLGAVFPSRHQLLAIGLLESDGQRADLTPLLRRGQ